MEFIELSKKELMEINGGISQKTIAIGGLLYVACPVAGLAYWVGYYVNC